MYFYKNFYVLVSKARVSHGAVEQAYGSE